jgi:hypothetical protein
MRKQLLLLLLLSFTVCSFGQIKESQTIDSLLKDKFVKKSEKKETKTDKPNTTNTLEEYTLNQLTGSYEIQAGMILELTLKNDSLHVLQTWDKSSYKITNTTGNTYAIPNLNFIQFVFSELKDDFTQLLTVFQNRNVTICKRKEESDLSYLISEEYTGKYYNEEFDLTLLFFLEDEKLKVQIANSDSQELTINGIDIFTLNGESVRFNRSNGVIKSVESNERDAGKVINLKFEKK